MFLRCYTKFKPVDGQDHQLHGRGSVTRDIFGTPKMETGPDED